MNDQILNVYGLRVMPEKPFFSSGCSLATTSSRHTHPSEIFGQRAVLMPVGTSGSPFHTAMCGLHLATLKSPTSP